MLEPLRAGDSRLMTITVKDVAGEPVDLTEVEIVQWMLARTEHGQAIIEKSLGFGITVVTAQAGIVAVSLDPVDTVDLEGLYHYQTRLAMPNPDSPGDTITATVASGNMIVLPSLGLEDAS